MRLLFAATLLLSAAPSCDRPAQTHLGGEAGRAGEAPAGSSLLLAVEEVGAEKRVIELGLHSGRFRAAGRCLELEVEGVLHTPVFYAPTHYEAETRTLVSGGSRFIIGEPLIAGGGPGPLRSASRVDAQVLRTCRASYFHLGALRSAPEGPPLPAPPAPRHPGQT
jgi:hypothetical protein